MTFYIRDTTEGIELVEISIGGMQIHLTCGTKLTAQELVRLSTQEGVWLNTRDKDD